MTRARSMLRSLVALAVLGGLGCTAHPARPAFRASVWIGDRGISIPLPPPSLLEAPKQKVDVQGEVVGDDPAPPGSVARLVDLHGEADATVDLDREGQGFVATGLEIDLGDNCLELWLEDEGGAESEHSLFTASVIVDAAGDQVVDVSPGCDDGD